VLSKEKFAILHFQIVNCLHIQIKYLEEYFEKSIEQSSFNKISIYMTAVEKIKTKYGD